MTQTRKKEHNESSGTNKRVRLSNVLSKQVGNESCTLSFHEGESYSLPHQARIQGSHFFKYVSITFDDGGAKESTDFILDDVVVEYKPTTQEVYENGRIVCTYLKSYVSVGIPTARYKWLLAEAKKKGNFYSLNDYSFSTTKEYTWIIAKIETKKTVSCTMYVPEKDMLETVGALYERMQLVKSNLIGAATFKLAIVHDAEGKHLLNFILQEFQVKNETNISGETRSFVDVAPPQDLVNLLRTPEKKQQ